MKEFDHPHVTKLIGKPLLLLVLQGTSRSCTIPHSLACSHPLLSHNSDAAATSVLPGVLHYINIAPSWAQRELCVCKCL